MTRINCAYGPAARPTVLPPQEDSGCHNGCRAREPDYHQRAIVRRAAGLHESGGRAGCHGANATGSPLGPSLASNRWLWSDGSYAGVLRAITEGVSQPKQYRKRCRWEEPHSLPGKHPRSRHASGASAIGERFRALASAPGGSLKRSAWRAWSRRGPGS